MKFNIVIEGHTVSQINARNVNEVYAMMKKRYPEITNFTVSPAQDEHLESDTVIGRNATSGPNKNNTLAKALGIRRNPRTNEPLR